VVKKYSDLYLETRRALMTQEDARSAGLMARNLIALYSGRSQEYILTNRELYAGEETCEKVEKAVARLLKGEPLAYVLGEWEFYGLPLFVNENVLIPRDDTVAVASLAIKQAIFLPCDPRVLDLCTGSGCIGLAVASRIKDARVTLADVSKDALAIAKKNIARHKLTGRVSCVQVDALSPAPAYLGKFDMIVSNPPYITGPQMGELDDSVKLYEPHLALYGGRDGLDFYRSIAVNYSSALKPGGFLCLEFGEEQGDDICRILEENGYTILERARDYNDTERAVLAQYGRKED
jgi:release factor glutamine methyltransferase